MDVLLLILKITASLILAFPRRCREGCYATGPAHGEPGQSAAEGEAGNG